MEDETEEPAASAWAAGGADPSTSALALGGASREQADAFLREQILLAREQLSRIRAQDKHVREEERLQLIHLRVRRFSDYAKMALQIAVGLLVTVIVGALAVMAWNAARDRDLVVDAFSVPPDLASRGLTGTVVASELLDHFGRMQAMTQPTAQTEGVYRLAVGDNVRIAIPETGVSVGELDHYLRNWLGHEVHVGGEIVRTPDGLVLTVRYGGKPGVQVKGAEADFDGLMKKAAEGLYAAAQPLRYGDYLYDQNRFDEAVAALKPLAASGAPIDRARALTSWAEAVDFDGRGREALSIIEQALRLDPQGSFAWAVDSDAQIELGHEEAAHAAETRMVLTAPRTWSAAQLTSSELAYLPFFIAQRRDGHIGDFAAAARDWNRQFATSGTGSVGTDSSLKLVEFAPQRAAAHDLDAARQAVASSAGVASDPPRDTAFANAIIGFYSGDWRAVADSGAQLEAARGNHYDFAWQSVLVRPLRAIAMARLGDTAGADALIAQTPTDCDLCARARGQIAAIKHDWRGVDDWFGLVARRSPSIPFADTDWGAALLMKGDIDGAIAKFRQANAVSPHFADPLKDWGDALGRQGRWTDALAEYDEALKYAPTWLELRQARAVAAQHRG